MATHQSLTVVSARLGHVWVGKPRGGSERLFVSRPGKSGISGGEYLGQIAMRYPWMDDRPEPIAPQIRILFLEVKTADGRIQQVADQELIYFDRQGARSHLFPMSIELGDLELSYSQVFELLRPHLHQQKLQTQFVLPRVPLRWNHLRQALTDGYISLPMVLPIDQSQVPQEMWSLLSLVHNQAEWDEWLRSIEGKTWPVAQKEIEQAVLKLQRQTEEAVKLQQAQQVLAKRPAWEAKAVHQLEKFFSQEVPEAERHQQVVRVVIKRATRAVHVVYRPGKSPSVFLFDKEHADQANLLLNGHIHPGNAAKQTLNGRIIRKVGKVTLAQAATHQVIRYLTNPDD